MDNLEYVFTFDTTSLAIKGEQALLNAKLPIKVMPLPNQIKAGCGLCLRVLMSDLPVAIEILDSQSINYSAIYEKTKSNEGSSFTQYLTNI